MKILALEFYKNGEMKEGFAFGGSLEKEKINYDDTVYLSTHTPEGVSSLTNNIIMKL